MFERHPFVDAVFVRYRPWHRVLRDPPTRDFRRQGRPVFSPLRDDTDPETGQRYTVKHHRSEIDAIGDSWRHLRSIFKPVNADFDPVILTDANGSGQHVIAEPVGTFQAQI